MEPESITSGKHTFSSKEKLKSRKAIQSLFEGGKVIHKSHLRVVYTIEVLTSPPFSPKFAVSVSKRLFKKAVDRNRLKRLIRETYRLHKTKLVLACINQQCNLQTMWIWTKPEILDFHSIQEMTLLLLEALIIKVGNNKTN